MAYLRLSSILFSLLLSPVLMAEATLRPFETDACTMFADGTRKSPELWKHCCSEHDLRYWFGGNQQDMDVADSRLKDCVAKVAGNGTARLMYMGVRLGHYSPIKNKYKWSWGWTTPRNSEALSKEEASLVMSELKKLKVDQINMDEFIQLNFP